MDNDEAKNLANLSLQTGTLYDESKFSNKESYVKYLYLLAKSRTDIVIKDIWNKKVNESIEEEILYDKGKFDNENTYRDYIYELARKVIDNRRLVRRLKESMEDDKDYGNYFEVTKLYYDAYLKLNVLIFRWLSKNKVEDLSRLLGLYIQQNIFIYYYNQFKEILNTGIVAYEELLDYLVNLGLNVDRRRVAKIKLLLNMHKIGPTVVRNHLNNTNVNQIRVTLQNYLDEITLMQI